MPFWLPGFGVGHGGAAKVEATKKTASGLNGLYADSKHLTLDSSKMGGNGHVPLLRWEGLAASLD